MDVHPLIRHEPDPDHPGWWTWDLRRRQPLQRRDRQAARPRRRAGAGGVPDVSGGAPCQSRRHGPWRRDPDLRRHGLVRRRAAGRGERGPGGDARSAASASSAAAGSACRSTPRSSCCARPSGWPSCAGRRGPGGRAGRLLLGRAAQGQQGAVTAVAERYRALVAAGELRPDADQERAVAVLDRLAGELAAAAAKGSLLWRLARRRRAAAARRLSVGRGRARQIDADGPRLRDDRPPSPSAGSISTNSCSRCTSGCAPSGRRRRATRSRRSPRRSPPRRRCSASTRW